MGGCPPRALLQGLLAERLADADRTGVETHIESCPKCQEILDQLSSETTVFGLPSGGLFSPDADADANANPAFIKRLKANPPPEFCGAAPNALSSAPEETDEIPTDLGRYRIEEELARGGMGLVLRAIDTKFGRAVAIKIMSRRLLDDEEMRCRFHDEIQITGRLQHPGIPAVHDCGTLPDGRPYFAMKLIKGDTVRDLLRERQATGKRAVSTAALHLSGTANLLFFINVFEKMCLAIAYAHERGVIHRDLKPSNVMVGAFGEVQVMDWGLAKSLKAREPGNSAHLDPDAEPPTNVNLWVQVDASQSPLTRAGRVLGTAPYMAPEQARREPVDERCDVFGLGAILCEILTGEAPFRASNDLDSLVVAQEAKLAKVFAKLDASGADRQLIQLAKSCLAPEPSHRPRNAGEVARAVAGYLEEFQKRLKQAEIEQAAALVKAEEERKRRKSGFRWAAVLVVMILLSSIAGVAIYLERVESDQRRHLEDKLKPHVELMATVGKKADEFERNLRAFEWAQQSMSQPDWQLDERRSTLAQVRTFLDMHPDASLAQQLKLQEAKLEKDDALFVLVRELDQIQSDSFMHLDDDDPTRAKQVEIWQASTAAKRYSKFFLNLIGLPANPRPADLKSAAERIRAHELRHFLVAALDHWADVNQTLDREAEIAHILQIAREADPDPWRDRFRQVEVWKTDEPLEDLRKSLNFAAQPPSILRSFAAQKKRARGDAAAVLQTALIHRPSDFWLNLAMAKTEISALAKAPQQEDPPGRQRVLPDAEASRKAAVALGSLRAALAVRPRDRVAWNNLGAALARKRLPSQAVHAFLKAAESAPESPELTSSQWNPHWQLGRLHLQLGRFAEARATTARAMPPASHPNFEVMKAELEEWLRCCDVVEKEKSQEIELIPAAGIKGILSTDDPSDPFVFKDFFFRSKATHRKTHRVELRKGKSYQIDLESDSKGKYDPILRIENDEWGALVANDDQRFNIELNSRIVYTPEKDGIFRLVVNSYHADRVGAYRLKVREVRPFGPANETLGQLTRSSDSEFGKYYQRHPISLTAGLPYVIELDSDSLDAQLLLLDGEGRELAWHDDIAPGDPHTSRIDYTPAENGKAENTKYFLKVSSVRQGDTGHYRLRVQGFK